MNDLTSYLIYKPLHIYRHWVCIVGDIRGSIAYSGRAAGLADREMPALAHDHYALHIYFKHMCSEL